MLAMRTTKSELNRFTYRNCNTSEQGAEKILQRKMFCPVFLRQTIPTGQKLTIKSKLTQRQ